ncbi:MAG: bifunctional 5,10-methylene-tetrahydrofolate dehydrogenase/5,10-methylene-tetrahydrofolate cyclohydrolase [Saprospirales bacterium]|nr:MAG: bifunctional 5,10-methylene-tetrahydrofolate dehydrogenase/5,10-methylene-tetrahydrofolate cyclohydrolase [Saprospirales bacterium]
MKLLDGKKISEEIKSELAEEVIQLRKSGKRVPHLAAVLVGDDPASAFYVKSKVKSCKQIGFDSTLIQRPTDITQNELLDIINKLNSDETIDGYIVQLPLPKHIDEEAINLAIDHRKDVDGFHPVNFGRMAQGLPAFLPATPYGIIMILDRYGIETSGKRCVVVGRSNIVGMPISILMARSGKVGNSTVIHAHSRTTDTHSEVKRGDIVIVAVGIPHFIKAEHVKEGAVVIDVGINRLEDSSKKKGYRIVGDVDFEGVAPKCSYITPVPGGVGLMTVTALLKNTMLAYKKEIYP